MNKENYKFMGLEETATNEELEAKYKELKAKYSEERWQYGEAGNEAAKNLTKLEIVYEEIKNERAEKSSGENIAAAYEEVANLLKEGKIAEAQDKLDTFNERGAEWHYLQSAVFYKKSWNNESKKQLEIAIEMDPNNNKYREAYGKLNAKNDYQNQQNTSNNQNTESPYENPDEQMGGNACSNCVSCCYTYLCVNCLFNCCCGCR